MRDNNWIKSSFCRADPDQCVEVKIGDAEDGHVSVQDSKYGEAGGTLLFTHEEWVAFIAGVKNGEFDVEDEVESVTTAIPEPASDAVPA